MLLLAVLLMLFVSGMLVAMSASFGTVATIELPDEQDARASHGGDVPGGGSPAVRAAASDEEAEHPPEIRDAVEVAENGASDQGPPVIRNFDPAVEAIEIALENGAAAPRIEIVEVGSMTEIRMDDVVVARIEGTSGVTTDHIEFVSAA